MNLTVEFIGFFECGKIIEREEKEKEPQGIFASLSHGDARPKWAIVRIRPNWEGQQTVENRV